MRHTHTDMYVCYKSFTEEGIKRGKVIVLTLKKTWIFITKIVNCKVTKVFLISSTHKPIYKGYYSYT